MNQRLSPSEIGQFMDASRGDPRARPADTRAALEEVAVETQTPIEVLYAMGEAAGAQTPEQFQQIARRAGQALGPRFQAGETVDSVVRSFAGDDEQAVTDFMAYARRINQQLYPDDWAKQPEPDTSALSALAYGAGEPIRNIGTTLRVLGAGPLGRALEATPQPENYRPAGPDFINAPEGEFSVGGFAPEYLPRAGVLEQAGQVFGSIASRVLGAIGGAAAGAAAGSVIPGVGTVAGGAAGAAAGAFGAPMMFEGLQVFGPLAEARAKADGREAPDQNDLLIAAATAASMGALNAIGARYLPGGMDVDGVMKAIGRSILGEGATEGAQSVLEQTGSTIGTQQGLEIDPRQAFGEGLIGGAAGGTATAIAAPFMRRGEQQPGDEQQAAQPPAPPAAPDAPTRGEPRIDWPGGVTAPQDGGDVIDLLDDGDPEQPPVTSETRGEDAMPFSGAPSMVVPPRERDVSTDDERRASVRALVREAEAQFMAESGRSLTVPERRDVIAALEANGGDVASAIVDRLSRDDAEPPASARKTQMETPVQAETPPAQPETPPDLAAVADALDLDNMEPNPLDGVEPTEANARRVLSDVMRGYGANPVGNARMRLWDAIDRGLASPVEVKAYELAAAMERGEVEVADEAQARRENRAMMREMEAQFPEDAPFTPEQAPPARGLSVIERGPVPDLRPQQPVRPLRMPAEQPAPDRGPAPDLRPQPAVRPLRMPVEQPVEPAPDLRASPVARPARPLAMPDEAWATSLIRARQKAREVGLTKEAAGDAWADLPALAGMVQERMRPAPVAAAAAQADPEPTEAQKEAGNYRKGHARFQGLDVTIENAKGSERRGRRRDGEEWSVTMPAHYGYVKRTEGADGDHLDVYIGDDEASDRAFVIDQFDPETGRFDEHKTVLGVRDEAEALALYDAGFSDGSGPRRRRGVTAMSVAEFKAWATDGDTGKPLAQGRPSPKKDRDGAQPVATFRTAKGSTYRVYADGTTQRDKAARDDRGHEGDSGPKPRTARTVYMEPDVAASLNPAGLEATWRVVQTADGRMSLATRNPDGRWGITASQRDLPFSTQPRAGLSPVELWSPETLNGRPAFSKIHVGNAITSLAQGRPAADQEPVKNETPAAPTASAPQTAPAGDGVKSTADLLAEKIAARRAAAAAQEAAQTPNADQPTRPANLLGAAMGTQQGAEAEVTRAPSRPTPDDVMQARRRAATDQTDEDRRIIVAALEASRSLSRGDEIALDRARKGLALDPSKWKPGDGVGYRVASARGGQINRGFRIVSVDPETKTAVLRQVADTGLTSTGGDNDRIGDRRWPMIDLVRDRRYDAPARQGQPTEAAQDADADVFRDTPGLARERRAIEVAAYSGASVRLRGPARETAEARALAEALGVTVVDDPDAGVSLAVQETSPAEREVAPRGEGIDGPRARIAAAAGVDQAALPVDAQAQAFLDRAAEKLGLTAADRATVERLARGIAAAEGAPAASRAHVAEATSYMPQAQAAFRDDAEATRPVADKPAPAKRARKPKPPTTAERARNYFRIGRDVPASDGTMTRVVAFDERDGRWSVTVDVLDAENEPTGERRVHGTLPSERVLKAWEAENPVGTAAADDAPQFDAERVDGGFHARVSPPEGGQRTFRDTLYPTREEAIAAAPEAWRRFSESATARGPRNDPDRIEDFGEKIDGARKDDARLARDMAATLSMADEPLSKTWPVPDYAALIEGGADARAVGLARALREQLPRKPVGWKVRRWTEAAEAARETAFALLNGEIDAAKADAALRGEDGEPVDRTAAEVMGRAALYDAFGHGVDMKHLALVKVRYSRRIENGQTFRDVTRWQVTTDAPRGHPFHRRSSWMTTGRGGAEATLVEAETQEAALDALRPIIAAAQAETPDAEPKGRKAPSARDFGVYSERKPQDGEKPYFIGRKVGGVVLRLARFDTAEEARAYRDANLETLTETLERMRRFPSERNRENRPRIGADHRRGVDVTPEQFADAFGFRGVQFGNWVEGDRRQADLNEAYDGLMDLAGVLGVPPRALSLNGELGLAFGARGKGGKGGGSAHYEPVQVVINLTKKQGAGALAHEWWHAVDNYFARRIGEPISYVTANPARKALADAVADGRLRKPVADGFAGVLKAIRDTGMPKRSREVDELGMGMKKGYWASAIEMTARAFEAHVIHKMKQAGGLSDYLANVTSKETWDAVAPPTVKEFGNDSTYPYPTEAEIGGISAAFDALFGAIETRETERGVEMYQRTADAPTAVVLSDADRASLAASIRERVGDDVAVRFEQSLADLARAPGAFEMRGNDAAVVIRHAADPEATAAHEVVHVARNLGLFTDEEWTILSNRARSKWLTEMADHVALYAQDGEEVQIEEAVAEAHARGYGRRDRAGEPLGVKRLLRRLGDMLEAVGNWWRGLGLQSARGILERLDRGEMAGRSRREAARDMTRERVDTSTAAFRRWFGDSKVVDENGEPLVVYRGRKDRDEVAIRVGQAESAAKQIDRMGPSFSAESEFVRRLGDVAWFTDDEYVADGYRDEAEDGEVLEAFLSIQKPLDLRLSKLGPEGFVDMIEQITGGRLPVEPFVSPIYGTPRLAAAREIVTDNSVIISWARDNGYDGVIHDDTDITGRYTHTSYVAFRPEQIKSVENRGTWSPDSPKILEQRRPLLSKQQRTAIAAVMRGQKLDAPIVIPTAPPVVKALGMKDVPLVMAQSVATKAGDEKHHLNADQVIEALEGLANPVMVFDSDTLAGTFLALVDVTGEPRPVVVALHPNEKVGRIEVTRIASVYAKENEAAPLRWMERGLTRYFNGKLADAWARSRGLQLPKDGPPTHQRKVKILRYADVFKGQSAPDLIREQRRPLSFLNRLPRARDEAAVDANERTIIDRLSRAASNTLTDAMGGASERYNLLALVPGRALFQELGKNLPSANAYLRTKEDMDALRNEWHAETDRVARAWQEAIVKASGATVLNRGKAKAAAKALADLMHDATTAGLDPAERFKAPRRKPDMRDEDYTRYVDEMRRRYGELRERWNALPEPLQETYRTVRDTFKRMADDVETAVAEAAAAAMDLQAERARARLDDELRQLRDDGMTGKALADAEEAARRRFKGEIAAMDASRAARIRALRLKFEQNRVEDPYFPLMRWGNYFVTVRDEDGKVVSFSKFERAAKQEAFAAEMRAEGFKVEIGVMGRQTDFSRYVDPNFVADVQEMLGGDPAASGVMDAIWQRWLETLPDYSIRKSRIHRKGTPGYDGDALRAFAHQMFHGAHQLARIKHGMGLTAHLEQAAREAAAADDPNRATLVVNEMQQRHEWTMNPQGSPWAAAATSAAFIWYLGVSPAAAMVNLSQTTIVGIPILTAGIEGATVGKTARHLGRALRDFASGKGWAETSKRLTDDERAAMREAYERGVLDKSHAHNEASVAESGVEYSGTRERVMRPIAYFFHHAERMNREITFLAAYRMAREAGMDPDAAFRKGADLTWKAHFDYSSSSRPRFMQGDVGKVLFVFRQFNVNMIYRLWRDTHQAIHGADEATRKEARAQLIGITASMMLHAGITGTWGYALLMTVLGLFFEGGSGEAEEDLKRGIVETFGPAAGILLKGVPGHLTGVDLSSRIGMPELWFRSPDRQLEGQEAYQFWLEQAVGAVPGIAAGMFRGVQWASEGDVWRGIETAGPKFLRDQMRSIRYLQEGVTTRSGEPVVEDLTPQQALAQAIGFTPAEVAERFEMNRRMRNMEDRIATERRKALRAAYDDLKDGGQISERTMERIQRFNERNPTWIITGDSIRQSIRSRIRMNEQMDSGLRITPKLDGAIRSQMAPALYS